VCRNTSTPRAAEEQAGTEPGLGTTVRSDLKRQRGRGLGRERDRDPGDARSPSQVALNKRRLVPTQLYCRFQVYSRSGDGETRGLQT
jgi:hypothetical protein